MSQGGDFSSNGHGGAETFGLAPEWSAPSGRHAEAPRRPDLGAQRPANLPHGAVRGGLGGCSPSPQQSSTISRTGLTRTVVCCWCRVPGIVP